KAAVDALPDTNADKSGLNDRVDAIDNQVPGVNDANSNGIPDNIETLITEIEDLVIKAEEAYAAAEDAYDTAVEGANETSGKYNTTQVNAFNKALTEAQKAKADALAKVEEARAQLPESIAKDFDDRLDALVDPVLPEVNTSDDDEPNLQPDTIITGRTFGSSVKTTANKIAEAIKKKNPNMNDESSVTAEKITTGSANDTVIVGRNNHLDTAKDLKVLPRFYSMKKTTIETGAGDDVVVVAGDVNNTVSVGTRTQAVTNPGSVIDTGDGNDIVKISNSIRNGSKVDTGSGDDTVVVGIDIKGGSKVLLGEGNDNLQVNGQIRYGIDITAGSGNDTVIINKGIDVNQAKSDANKVVIDLGDGDNALTIGAKYANRLVNALEVNSGDGADVITINSNKVNNIQIQSGAGDDTIDLQASTFVQTYTGMKAIDAGAGNDTIKLGKFGNLANTNKLSVNAGEGDDTVELYYSYDSSASQNQGLILGGTGSDTLSLKGSGITVNLASSGSNAAEEGIKGFERIDMTDSGAQTVKLTLADVLNNNDNKVLYISGNSADTVDLGADNAASLGGFTKVESDKVSGAQAPVAGHSYTAYTNGDVKVYIDDTITNII
ncbi:GA-like domain-containing protein, partial [Rodentibacter caecimuris]|uniref:GA-like domain-containing protein n=1 Tax=Rodentibacter caecimuris TaxID=1796644 RepID=UPI0019564122